MSKTWHSYKKAFFLSLLFLSYEAKAKIFVAIHETDTFPKCVILDEKMDYRMRPNCSEWLVRAGKLYHLAFNSVGLRDKEYPPYPEKGTIRIMLLGSSGVTGDGLDEADTIPRLLERSLNSGTPKARVEVINAGVSGFTPFQMALFLPELIEKYHPNLIFCDPSISTLNSAQISYSPLFQWENDRPKKMSSFEYLYGRFSLLSEKLGNRVWDWGIFPGLKMFATMLSRLNTTNECLSKNGGEQISCLLSISAKSMLSMQQYASQRGIKIYFVLKDEPVGNTLVLTHNSIIARAIDLFTKEYELNWRQVNEFFAQKGITTLLLQTNDLSQGATFDGLHFDKSAVERVVKNLLPEIKIAIEKTISDRINKKHQPRL